MLMFWVSEGPVDGSSSSQLLPMKDMYYSNGGIRRPACFQKYLGCSRNARERSPRCHVWLCVDPLPPIRGGEANGTQSGGQIGTQSWVKSVS